MRKVEVSTRKEEMWVSSSTGRHCWGCEEEAISDG